MLVSIKSNCLVHTFYYLFTYFNLYLASGETMDKKILIQGGAGGVGSFAIQYCTAVLNMKVTTTCSPKHIPFCSSLGAIETIDYNKQKFEEVVSGILFEKC
jgi:NADPH:quinone reductase-like Zn-dependent oxidoreductase